METVDLEWSRWLAGTEGGLIEVREAKRNARAGGVDGAKRSEVDAPSPGIARSGANGDQPSRSGRQPTAKRKIYSFHTKLQFPDKTTGLPAERRQNAGILGDRVFWWATVVLVWLEIVDLGRDR